MKLFITALILIVLIFIGIIIGVKNDSVVTINYLIAQSQTSLSNILAIVFTAGFVVAWLLSGLLYFKIYLSNRVAKRRIKKLENKINQMQQASNDKKSDLLLTADPIKIEKLT